MTEHKEELRIYNEREMKKINKLKLQFKEIDQEYKDKKYFLAEEQRKQERENNDNTNQRMKKMNEKRNELKTNQ